MFMPDPHRNEFVLLKRIMIALVAVVLLTSLFTYITAGLILDIGCSGAITNGSVCGLVLQQSAISQTANAIGTSFNNATITPITPLPSSDLGAYAINAFISLPNIVWHLGVLIYNVISLFARIIYLIVYVIFALIPALLNTTVGIFSVIFQVIEIFTTVIIIGYFLYIVLNRVPLVH